jgi:hypothetical protein
LENLEEENLFKEDEDKKLNKKRKREWDINAAKLSYKLVFTDETGKMRDLS